MNPDQTERAAAFLLDNGLVSEWTEGSIFPTEMAFFLALCESENVSIVIESGRENGYSTLVLGHWAKARGAQIISIDREEFPEIAARCRARLNGYPVQMVKGDGFSEVGRSVLAHRGSAIALLLDGPKGFGALAIAAAAAADVRVAAFHNLNKGTADRTWVTRHGGMFYEDLAVGPQWELLREAELQQCHPGNRTIAYSTLGAFKFGPGATNLPMLSPSYGVIQPMAIRLAWNMGAFLTVPQAVNLKDRIVGRLKRLFTQ